MKILNKSIWLGVFILTTALLIFANRAQILTSSYAIGDAAANSLLILDAKSFHLWVGNYSRVGFNHPGPAILYVLAGGEALFYDGLHLVKTPLSGQFIAVAFYNAFWISLLGVLFFRLFSLKSAALLSFSVFLFVVSLIKDVFFTDLWFPYLYFFPFSVALLSFARFSEGKTDSLVFLALAGGVLINGHVCFIPILGILFISSIAYNFVSKRNTPHLRILSTYFWKEHLKSIFLFFSIIFIFCIPLIVETLQHFPGPIPQYIHFSTAHKANTFSQAMQFVSVYWGGLVSMLTGLLTYWFIFCASHENTDGIRNILAAVFYTTLAALLYAKFGVDKINESYMEFFYYSVPALLAATLSALIWQQLQSKSPQWLSIFLSVAILFTCFLKLNFNAFGSDEAKVVENFPQNQYLVDVYHQIKIHQLHGRLILDLNSPGLWTSISGVALIAKRSGDNYESFCINKGWDILYTKKAKCTAEDLLAGNRYSLTFSTSKEKLSDGDFQVDRFLFRSYHLQSYS